MNVVAYCAQSYQVSVARAAGVRPHTCPPLDLHAAPLTEMESADLLYLKLHGLPAQPYLYGDNFCTALTCDQVAALDLSGTLVFAPACYLLESPFVAAFAAANTQALVAGRGPHLARALGVDGADRLGRLWRFGLQAGLDPEPAFRLARRLMWPAALRSRATRQAYLALQFIPGSPSAGSAPNQRSET